VCSCRGPFARQIEDAERQLERPSAKRVETPILFTRARGRPLAYSAVACAWQDGIRHSKVLPFMFREIRAR